MCAQQINSSQGRVSTTYLSQQKINIDGEIASPPPKKLVLKIYLVI